ncbi:MAG: HAMP domain-containing protein [Anaerolineales bacterium]|nr:HAMP domain-containing protein [Anaerolineales bacterium]
MPRSLTWKLTFAFLLVAATVSILPIASVRLLNPSQFNTLVVSQLREDFRSLLADYYQAHGTWAGLEEYLRPRSAETFPAPQTPSAAATPSSHSEGGSVPAGRNPHDWRSQFSLADAEGVVVLSADPEVPAGNRLSANALAEGEPILVDGAAVGTILTAPRPPNLSPQESRYLERLNVALLLAGSGAFLIALGMGVWLARTLTRPLQALKAAAHRMAEGDLDQQVQSNSRDEIGELAAAFNKMSRAVSQSNRARRKLAADVAHELRTPLTVISGYIESLRDGVLAPSPKRLSVIYDEIELLQLLVEDLRILSEADAGELEVIRQPVDPADLLRQACAAFEQQALQKNVVLEVDVPAPVPPIGLDETRMAQVLANLIGNALRHTPPGGRITLGTREDAKEVLLTVGDTGNGISAEDLPHIFDRFYRADDGGASGLGLAIARALVAAHGGMLEAESAPGEGTRMRIRLPRRPNP